MLKQHPKVLSYTAQVLDLVVLVSAFLLAFPFRDFVLQWLPYGSRVNLQSFTGLLLLNTFLWWLFLRVQGTYGSQRLISHGSLAKKVFRTALLVSLTLFSIAYIIKWAEVPRTLILASSFLSFLGLLVEKFLWLKFLEYLRKKGKGCSDVLMVGTSEIGREFVESISKFSDWGLRIVGVLIRDGHSEATTFCDAPVLGGFNQLAKILHFYPVDEVIFALPTEHLEDAQEMMEICELEGVKTRIISDFFRGIVFKASADVIHGVPIITYSPAGRKDWQLFIKRISDLGISFTGLTLLSPVFMIISLLVKLTSRGPVFYKWKVMGLNKKPITSYKFRTMVENADKLKKELLENNVMKGPAFKMQKDPRITRVGRVLRKFSLDELPQLWSVLKGDLSLVGPHPPLQSELYRFDDWHRRKLSVKPGLTCFWQINGRNKVNDFDEWVKLDLKYIDNWCLWLDFKIFLKTVPAVLKGTGM